MGGERERGGGEGGKGTASSLFNFFFRTDSMDSQDRLTILLSIFIFIFSSFFHFFQLSAPGSRLILTSASFQAVYCIVLKLWFLDDRRKRGDLIECTKCQEKSAVDDLG